MDKPVTTKCLPCGGTGWVCNDQDCPDCNGTGKVVPTQTTYVDDGFCRACGSKMPCPSHRVFTAQEIKEANEVKAVIDKAIEKHHSQTTELRREIAQEVKLGETSIANICDAFLDGFHNAYRKIPHPYKPESGEHTAYLYGRALGGNQ